MKKSAFFLLALAASSTLVSCGDDKKSEDPKPKTKAEILAAHDWIISGVTITIGGQTKDAFEGGLYEECEKDDYFHFVNTSNGGTYTLNENTKVCSQSSADKGTWSLSADQSKLTLTPQNGGDEEFIITELNNSSLKLAKTDDFLGTPLTVNAVYKVK